MKKTFILALAVLLVGVFASFSLVGCGEESKNDNQGMGSAQTPSNQNNLGDYSVEIKDCRLAKDYEGKDVVIVKYGFTNNADKSQAFYIAFETNVFQNGVGLNEAYVLDDSAKYDEGNQTKEIKPGRSLDVEVAYELNDTKTDIEVEVTELFSFDDKTVTKTFSIK